MADIVSLLIQQYGLIGILIASFLSYSLFPVPTEPVLILGLAHFSAYTVLLFSLIGATLGSILNYIIGLKGIRLLFVNSQGKAQKKAEGLFTRWGPLSIVLLGWVPIIGDPLFLVAGLLRMNFWRMLLYSILGKLWYFALVIWFGGFFF